ncbi:hypothetical protein P4631_08560 [Halalkalibacterium halodurans]|nr:hypothetical protein [Halalkalibacterium halodurans]
MKKILLTLITACIVLGFAQPLELKNSISSGEDCTTLEKGHVGGL